MKPRETLDNILFAVAIGFVGAVVLFLELSQ